MKFLIIVAIIFCSCQRRVIEVEREEWILKRIEIREMQERCCILTWVNQNGTEFTELATARDTIMLRVGSGVLNRTPR